MAGASATRAVRRASAASSTTSALLQGSDPFGVRPWCLARCQREEEPAVLVVGREEVDGDLLLAARVRAHRQLLVELAYAPFAHGLDRLPVGERERVGDLAAHQV